MDIAVKAHVQKRKFIAQLMSAPDMPLWQIGKTAARRPPLRRPRQVHLHHRPDRPERRRPVPHRPGAARERRGPEARPQDRLAHVLPAPRTYGKELGLKFSARGNPRRERRAPPGQGGHAQLYPQAREVMQGRPSSGDEFYYTNSIHLRADAPVDLLTRIRKQSEVPHPDRVRRHHPRLRRRGTAAGRERPRHRRKDLRADPGRAADDLARVHHLQRLPQDDRRPHRTRAPTAARRTSTASPASSATSAASATGTSPSSASSRTASTETTTSPAPPMTPRTRVAEMV